MRSFTTMEDAQTEVYSGKTNKKSRCSLRASINTSSISEEYMRDNHIYIYSRLYKYLEIHPDLPKSEKIRTASSTNKFWINGEESTWPILDTLPKTTGLYISSGNPGNGKSYIYRMDFPIVSRNKTSVSMGDFRPLAADVQTLFGFLCS